MLHRLQRESGITILQISHELTVIDGYATDVLSLGSGHSHFGPPAMLTPDVLRAIHGERIALHDSGR
jgi:ABC-type Mn2+/Zn2+ transport system ATPase subunit